MSGASVIFVTVGNEEEAVRIVQTLVQEKLAACGSIVPKVRSIYRWKGEVCDEGEVLVILKTRFSLFTRVQDRVRELHSYELPEIVSFPIEMGLAGYIDWIFENTLAS